MKNRSRPCEAASTSPPKQTRGVTFSLSFCALVSIGGRAASRSVVDANESAVQQAPVEVVAGIDEVRAEQLG